MAVHDHLASCLDALRHPRLFAFSRHAKRPYTDVTYVTGDALLFGSESTGLGADLLGTLAPERQLRLPMFPHNRSLNLSNAVAIALYEAWRQLGFAGAAP